jgi:predicted metallo-beta-lactamase superfamily hydrolase
MTTKLEAQAKMRTLSREAVKLVKEKAPAIVDEQILAHLLDEVADYAGDIMGKLTNLDADNEKAIVMAHGIIRDGLFQEIINQVTKTMLAEADKRITKLFTKK